MMNRFTAGLLAVAVAASGAGAQTKAGAGAATPGKTSAAPALLRYVVAPAGNEARYRVREQLAGFDLPNDAVGATPEITGSLLVDPTGKVIRDSSKIVVTLTNLNSDKDRRDNYVRRRTLETDKFPTVELVPNTFKGLAAKPTGPTTFELTADLTVRGVTRPTTWKVTARPDGNDVVGSATTAFAFKDFAIDQPKVASVLSVADTIRLEYDFRFTSAAAKP